MIYKQLSLAIHDYRRRNNRKPDEIRISNQTLDLIVAELKANFSYVQIETVEKGYWFCDIKLIPDDEAKGIELIAKERFSIITE